MRKLLLLLTVFLGGTFAAMASHVMGSDITYKCISNLKFEITLKIYRDCRGIPLGNPGTFAIQCASGGSQRSFTYSKTSIKDITPKCRTSGNPCNPQNTTVSAEGVEEHTYKGTIDFNVSPLSSDVSGGCCEFKIFYDECCRNGAINTGSAGNFYADAIINICRAPCNNSPKMTNEPIAYLCCNQPFTFNNGVNDTVDYDSISYELGTAKETAGTNFSYGGGYSNTKPLTPYLPGSPNQVVPTANPPIGFYLDPIKGDIIFTPTGCNEVGPVVIQVNEWRKDSTGTYRKIGETRRDLQFIVRTCPGNNPPTITGSAGYNYNVCEGSQLCFNIITRDQQFIVPPPQTSAPPDSIEVTWNNGIGGATFTVDSVTTITGGTNGALSQRNARFCWTPPIGKASSLPYTFTVTAKDNSCNPRPAASTRAFSVIVKPIAQADRVFTILPCGKVKFQAFPKSNYVSSFSWTIRDSLNQPINTQFVNKTGSNKALDTFQFKKGGKYVVLLQVNNPPHNCSNLYLDTIVVPEMLQVDLALTNDTFVCAGNSITLKATVKYGANPFRYRWITGATNDTLDTKTMTPGADSIAAIRVTDKNLCVVYDTVRIRYIPLPVIDLGPDKRICDYDSTTFDAGNPGMTFEWNNTAQTQVITAKSPGEYIVRVIDSLGCYSRDTVILNVNDHVKAIAGPDRELCRGDTIKIGGGGASTTGGKTNSYQWTWLNGSNRFNNLGDTLSVFSDAVTNFELRLQTTQSSVMCESFDTVEVSINELPILTKNPLEDRCFDFGQINLNNDMAITPQGGIYSYPKNPTVVQGGNTFDTRDVGNKNLTTTVYFTYTYTDAKGCVSRDSVPQKIFRLPAVVIRDTIYCRNVGPRDLKDHVITPKVTTGSLENWISLNEPGSITKSGNKFMFDPAYRPAPFTYTVVYEFTDPNGCTNRDTAVISIIDVPVIDFGTKAGPYCMDDGLIDLSVATSVSPSGGKWKCREKPGMVQDSAFLNTAISAGTYFFQYEHRNTGCYVVDSVQITINPLPVVSVTVPAGKETVCTSEPPFKINASPPGGVYSSPTPNLITPGGVLDPKKKPATPDVETGAYEIWYNYTDPVTKCKNIAKTIIKIQEAPTVTISSAPEGACEGNTFTLTAVQKYSPGVSWDSDGSDGFSSLTGNSTVYTPTTADIEQGTINITVTTAPNGVCPVTSASMPIEIWRIPAGTFVGNPTEGCAPHNVEFSLDLDPNVKAGKVDYLWNFGDPQSGDANNSTEQDPKHTYTLEGKYDVSVIMTSEKGCTRTLTLNQYITVFPVPKAMFDVDPQTRFTTIALPKFTFVNKSTVSSGSFTSAWDFGVVDSDQDTSTLKHPVWTYSNSPKDTGTYIVTLVITTDGGCTDIHIDSVRIGPDLTVFIPNAFTPNRFGPGINNKFYVSAQGFASFEINIFNRWGEKLYHSTDISEGWDGLYKGQEAQQDVYVYQVNVTSFSGKVYKYNGTITLLR